MSDNASQLDDIDKCDNMMERVMIMSDEVVIGDLIEISSNSVLCCDIILLNGSCIVNESILTGESIPVIKSELPDNSENYDVIN